MGYLRPFWKEEKISTLPYNFSQRGMLVKCTQCKETETKKSTEKVSFYVFRSSPV